MNATFQASKASGDDADFSKLRIVHVVRQYVPNVGGLEDVVRNLVRQQQGRFADLKVVTLDRLFKNPDVTLAPKEFVDGIEVTRIPFRGSSRYPLAPSVLNRISEADLVHVHAVDFFFDALAFSRVWHGKKLVATTHGGFFHTRKFARAKSVWFNTITRFSAGRYDAIACCSNSDLEMFAKIAPQKIRLIENGVGIDKFSGAASEKPGKGLLTLGRFSTNKRLDRLIGMMPELVSRDPAWKLHIAGVESDLTRDGLAALIDAHDLSENVSVHVGLSDQELRSLMGECSLFVSASEFEGFGLALIEALSAGLIPVVHANDAFVSLANSIPLIGIADFADPEAALSAANTAYESLRTDPENRARAIEAVKSFGWPAKAHQYEGMYRQALSG